MKIICRILLLLMVSFQFGCDKTKAEVKSIKNPKGAATKEVITENTTTEIDDYSFPVDSLLKVNLLLTEVFHGDEVDPNLQKKIWFGLFKNGDNYSFSKISVSINQAYDPIIDEEEGEKTGWEVSTTAKDTCVVLVEKLPGFADHTVEFVKIPEYIYPKENLEFQFLGSQYKLYATGEKKKENPDSDWWVVTDYKLYLKTIINGKEVVELLAAKESFEDRMIRIIFAGDIDGDGKLDLIIDTSSHYNTSSLTLYLSKSADKHKIIKPVGIFTSVGC
ncbi:hypothetical protein ACFFLS_02675 [Flavobacterium procerum]|uniref:VCBS repeat-containing protein n=1 Tax=Flavobacterium procerum TaxID=1455569 RepID=A0ABV6BKF7_9FLAO